MGRCRQTQLLHDHLDLSRCKSSLVLQLYTTASEVVSPDKLVGRVTCRQPGFPDHQIPAAFNSLVHCHYSLAVKFQKTYSNIYSSIFKVYLEIINCILCIYIIHIYLSCILHTYACVYMYACIKACSPNLGTIGASLLMCPAGMAFEAYLSQNVFGCA